MDMFYNNGHVFQQWKCFTKLRTLWTHCINASYVNVFYTEHIHSGLCIECIQAHSTGSSNTTFYKDLRVIIMETSRTPFHGWYPATEIANPDYNLLWPPPSAHQVVVLQL